MDEKEIRASMDRLMDAWSNQGDAAATLEAFKLATDALVKFTRLVEAIECIAGCQIDITDGIMGQSDEATLEAARPEGSC
jgi:hypothetical protein